MAADSLEVLLVRRNPQARFMGGAWVFPGWRRRPREGEGQTALRAAAVREVAEEAGIAISEPGSLVLFSRWITPAQVKIRFDTWFYLAPMPAGASPHVDGSEIVDARWYQPQDALDAHRGGNLFMVFPTIKHLEQLSQFPSADAVILHARDRDVRPVQPRVVAVRRDRADPASGRARLRRLNGLRRALRTYTRAR